MTAPSPGAAADRARRQGAWRRGRAAEAVAALLLRLKGYRILARDLRTPVGEIDLIARRGRVLVFVEVKGRPPEARTTGDALPTARQRRRIVRTAELFRARHPGLARLDVRFDVILIGWRRWPRHLPAAFRADD